MKKSHYRILVRAAGLILIVGIAIGAVMAVREQNKSARRSLLSEQAQEKAVSPELSSKPIVRENKGVTEISLPSAPEVTTQATIEELKEFRKRSEELERTVAALTKEKKESELVVGLGDAPLKVEPLYTFEQQQKGLIGRESLPEDSGMLYIFQMDDSGRLFGTKGMKFPVDIIWANNDRTVVHIHKNVPPNFVDDLKSLWPARYVLEVNGGYADKHGIDVGDTIDLSKIPH
ncbi:DUF192 domain-containing protein [Candidatus Uhrbacteria bacterium]|nr:DUF192 domain-containing protein [Candidatus Uhrbacteria bacterium]